MIHEEDEVVICYRVGCCSVARVGPASMAPSVISAASQTPAFKVEKLSSHLPSEECAALLEAA